MLILCLFTLWILMYENHKVEKYLADYCKYKNCACRPKKSNYEEICP